MTQLKFTMTGPPVGKQRPRVTKRGTYTPERTRRYESALHSCAFAAANGFDQLGRPLPGACFSLADAKRPWPLDRRYRLRVEFTGRCDGDNVAKSVADALEGICWNNDRQVDEVTAVRLKDGPPRTVVTVEILES